MNGNAEEKTEESVEQKNGKETDIEPQKEMDGAGSEPQALPPSESENEDSGIGGWLIALIIMLVFAHPLFTLFTTSGALHLAKTENPALLSLDAWVTFTTICWAIAVFCIVCSIAAGACLYIVRTRKSAKFAVVAIWLIFPLSKLCIMLASIHTLGASDSPFSEMSGDLIGDLLIASIFTFYLIHSKHAKSVYK